MKTLLCLLLPFSVMTTQLPAQVRPAGKTGHRKHGRIQYGTASFYSNRFQDHAMSGGDLYDKNKMTCAHNSLPMGTWLKVTNLLNKRSVVVCVTDRLHKNNSRIVDLSRIAASKLGYLKRGLAKVKIEILAKKP